MANLVDIPGLAGLWERTRGDARIRIAQIDGPVRLDHECFEGANIEVAEPYWHDGTEPDPDAVHHGTFVASQLVGQPEGPVPGVAPGATLLSVPIPVKETVKDWVVLTRTVELAHEWGPHVLHCAACYPSADGRSARLFQRAVERCLADGIVVVAPVGNAGGEGFCVPASIPGVIPVGALNDDGTLRPTSNFGGPYRESGILAPGQKMLGAAATGGTARESGSSCAAPVVSGVAALLLSLQLQEGGRTDTDRVGRVLVETATPCDPDAMEDAERCHRGVLNVTDATARVLEDLPPALGATASTRFGGVGAWGGFEPAAFQRTANRRGLVFAVGELSYDFGSEVRRDAFARRMSSPSVRLGLTAADPDDPAGMAEYLGARPEEAASLIWRLDHEGVPVYAIEPRGGFAPEVFATLARLLASGRASQGADPDVERISLSGVVAGRGVRLRSGESVPVVGVEVSRGLYGWNTHALAGAALGSLRFVEEGDRPSRVHSALRDFLNRVYYELAGLGDTSRTRALNFAATNALQVSTVLTQAVAEGMELAGVAARRSAFCRTFGNCWDVRLTFFDPSNRDRGDWVFLFTIDVADLLPVTMGRVRSWWAGRAAQGVSG